MRGIGKSIVVWTLILPIAFMAVGHPRAGFAQTEADGPVIVPSYVIVGQNANLQYWKTPDGAVSQALYTSVGTSELVSVRVFYDETTGLPRKVHDEVSGNWMLIQENGLYGVDFWLYDSDGNYQSGFAVYEDGGLYHFGEIVGLPPVHAGKQITGELQPAASVSWTGSFTLSIGADDLINIQAVPPEIAVVADGMAPTNVCMEAESNDSQVDAGLEETEGSATSSELLSGVGMTLLALGEASDSGSWAISGAVGLVSRRFLHPATVRNSRQLCGEGDVLEEGGQPPTVLAERGWQSFAYAEDRHFLPDQRDDALQSAAHEPTSVDQPPSIAAPVSGHVMDPGNRTVLVAGTISPEGTVTVSGNGVQIRLEVSVDGELEGQFEWGSFVGRLKGWIYDVFEEWSVYWGVCSGTCSSFYNPGNPGNWAGEPTYQIMTALGECLLQHDAASLPEDNCYHWHPDNSWERSKLLCWCCPSPLIVGGTGCARNDRFNLPSCPFRSSSLKFDPILGYRCVGGKASMGVRG